MPLLNTIKSKSFLLVAAIIGLFLLAIVFTQTRSFSPSLTLSDASVEAQPVHRFWSENFQHHFYTLSESERDFVVRNDRNWRYEGIVYSAFEKKHVGTVPVYRFWSDTYKGHFYSKNESEVESIRRTDPNWRFEGIAFHVFEEGPQSQPIFRFFIPEKNSHFYTPLVSERDQLIADEPTWVYEGIAFYTSRSLEDEIIPEVPALENPLVNGSCGSSHGGVFDEQPVNQFCASGTASDLSGDGPWEWSCSGSDGGFDVRCSAQRTSVPQTECADGVDNDGDGYIDTDDHDCLNANDDTESGTNQAVVHGSCGANDGQSLSVAPVDSLCSNGIASAVAGDGPWSWECSGLHGGDSVSCDADIILETVHGECGSSNQGVFAAAPSSGLCASGTHDSVSGSGPWSWVCTGSADGSIDECSADVLPAVIDGVCGQAHEQPSSSLPADVLCAAGSATEVLGDGPWSWTCEGINNGVAQTCSAPVVMPPINGSCGSSHGESFDAQPTDDFCDVGIASAVTGDGPWSWQCSGLDGGSAAVCSAQNDTVQYCGVDHGQSLDAAPTNELCQRGTVAADQTGSGPWSWTCRDTDGVIAAVCQADSSDINPSIVGQCGISQNTCSTGVFIDRDDTETDYLWGCVGSGGFDAFAECSIPKDAPYVSECNDGIDNDNDGFVDGDDFDCENANDDSEMSAIIPVTNGQCSSLAGQSLTVDPSIDDLCDAGTPSATSIVDGEYLWSCLGLDGGVHSDCAATWDFVTTPISGICNPSLEPQYVDLPPADQLCSSGNATDIQLGLAGSDDYFSWYCEGISGGSSSQCTVLQGNVTPICSDGIDNDNDGDIDFPNDLGCSDAYDMIESDGPRTDGQCGSNDAQLLASVPVSGLCSAGEVSAITGEGPWSWTCGDGRNGAAVASCATVALPIVACGPSHQTTFSYSDTWTFPSEPCLDGATPQWQTESGDANPRWVCEDVHGGLSQQCLATLTDPPVQTACSDGIDNDGDTYIDLADFDCESADDVTESGGAEQICGPDHGNVLSGPPTQALCLSGTTPAQETGSGPWQWVCLDDSNDIAAVCESQSVANPGNIVGVCGNAIDTCATGVFIDEADSATDYLWGCIGSGGFDQFAQCSQSIAVTACNDGIDNDNDGYTDYPEDFDCENSADDTESVDLAASCGLDHGQILSSAPTRLCIDGTSPTQQTGSGPWQWACADTNGSLLSICEASSTTAQTEEIGVCGGTINTCSVGTFIDAADSNTQALWGCVGSGGFTTFAECSLDL